MDFADPRCNTEDPWVSVVQTIANAYVQPVIAIFGIIGNVLLLFTIYYGHLKDSPYVYLTNIAIGNLFICFSYQGLIWARCTTCVFTLNTWYNLNRYERYIFLVISNLFISWLTYITTVMTMERYVYVRWPLKTQRFCKRERARKICFVLFFVSCTAQLTRIWDFDVSIATHNIHDFGNGTHSFTCDLENKEESSSYICSWEVTPDNATLKLCRTNEQWNISSRYLKVKRNDSYVDIDIYRKNSSDFIIYYEKDEFMDTTNTSMNQICGSAFEMDDRCLMLLSITCDSMTEKYHEFYNQTFETIDCVVIAERNATVWYEHARQGYLYFWDKFNIVCTVILTVFSVLIILVVHGANQNARTNPNAGEVPPDSRRKRDENRLTVSLLALSTLKIITEVVYSTATFLAPYIYGKDFIYSRTYDYHNIVSNGVVVTEYALNFYLLAFINRKFRMEFLKQVMALKILKSKNVQNICNKFYLSFQTGSSSGTKSTTASSGQKDVHLKSISGNVISDYAQ